MALTAIKKLLGPDDPEQVAYIANLAGVLQVSAGLEPRKQGLGLNLLLQI